MYKIVYTKAAAKDAPKLRAVHLTEKAKALQKAGRKKPMLMSGAAHTGTTEVLRRLTPYVLESRKQRGNLTSTDTFDDHDD